MPKLTLAVFVLLIICAQPVSRAQQPVALELVLAVDSSTSVSDSEYQLQVTGYVDAFRDADVIAAIAALAPKGLAVTFVQWSSHRNQVQSVDWQHVTDKASAVAFSDAIAANARRIGGSSTAIGDAVLYSVDLLESNDFAGDRRTIDVSADDRYNAGSSPAYARDFATKRQIVVNGLVIDPTNELASFFRRKVIGGEGAFVMTIGSFEHFAHAIKLKLLRELADHAKLADIQ